MSYEIDQFYDLNVVGGTEPSDEFFLLEVESPTGQTTIPFKKLPFQRQKDYVCPDTLNCRIKGFDECGLPVLKPNIISYVNTLYERQFLNNESFECTVVSVPSSPTEACTICDENGIYFRIKDSEGLLGKGQKVKMRMTKLTSRYYELTRADEGTRFVYFTPVQILDNCDLEDHCRGVLLHLFDTLDDMSTARVEAKAYNSLWVLTACRTALRQMSEWFLHARLREHINLYTALLQSLRSIMLYLLEGSNYLNAAPTEQRRSMQQQLTDMVDALEPYEMTLGIIARNGEDAFVEGLLDKLQKSGYLYHPARQFAVLMLIFRLNTDKVGNYLNRIFDSIFGRDLENWKREPFRSAFVEQFEIYVRHARNDIDSLPVAENRSQKARIEMVITAIALQILLSEKDADLSLISSLFYRYVALLRPLHTELLLSTAYVSLMGGDVSSRLTYSQLKEPMMMMTQATIVPAHNIFATIDTTHRFSGGGMDIAISRNGLEIRPSGRNDITERAIPDGLMPWLDPQIRVNGVRGLSGNRLRNLNEHNIWWHSLEQSIYEQQFRPDEELTRHDADIDDRVYIVVDGIDHYDGETAVFACHIDDPEFNEAWGTLRCDSIVGYKLRQPPMQAFKNANGSVRGFLATVYDKEGSSYFFSLAETVDSYIDDVFNYDSEYKAVITGINENDYSVISSVGIGLFLERRGAENHEIGDFVSFRLSQKGVQGKLRGYITATLDPEIEAFDKNEAFRTLMDAIGETDETQPDDMVADMDEFMTLDQMHELVEIIRFKAICENDLIKAYDYINLALLLAKAMDNQSLVERLETHAALLTMHQFFATNSRIDAELLEKLQPRAVADPFLAILHHRLKMVSWLGKTEHDSELYQTVREPQGDFEASIARMVLAYNMLQGNDEGNSSISADIKQKIMARLNVNNETRPGKYYGSESKYLEFKTSIVFPATAPGEEMRENPLEQQFHILSRIAGFLNANGGRLNLGVNNEGFDVGLHDDFKYFERHKAMVKNFQFKISNLDNLTVFLEELINQTFEPKISRKISVSVDEEAVKGVILFDIEQSLEPVFLDGRLFVRQSGQATREYHGEAIEEFVREREDLLAEHQHLVAQHKKEQAAARISLPTEQLSEPKAKEAEQAAQPTQPTSATLQKPTIASSGWRPNVLHDYEMGYNEPFGYLYFNGEDTLLFSQYDLYMDDKDDNRLALVVPHELSKGYLLLAYEGERVLKIPMHEIVEQAWTPVRYNTDYHLLFAALAGRNDALACVGADSGAALSQRITRLSLIDNAHLTSTPKRIHDAPNHHTVAYEITDETAISNFSDSFAETLGSKRFGFTMRVKEDTPGAEYKLNELVKRCAPAF